MNKKMLKVKLAELKNKFDSLAPQEKKEFADAYKEASQKLSDTNVPAQQRRAMANSVFGKYTKKITALVASVLVVSSLLAGCDKDQTTNNTDTKSSITINTSTIEQETDSNGDFLETRNEILARTLWADNEKTDLLYPEILNSDTGFNIDKVLDSTYINNVNNYMKEVNDIYDSKEPINRGGDDFLFRGTYKLLAELAKEDSSYAFDIYAYRNNTGNSYQILKEGKDTACLVITKRDGSKVVNGYLDGKAYFDGQDLVPNNIPLLTEEYANLITQTGTENPALMWAQGVCGSLFGVDETTKIDGLTNGSYFCGYPDGPVNFVIKKDSNLNITLIYSFERNEEVTHPNPLPILPNQFYYVDEVGEFSLLGLGISTTNSARTTTDFSEVFLLGGYAMDPQQVRAGLQTEAEAEK